MLWKRNTLKREIGLSNKGMMEMNYMLLMLVNWIVIGECNPRTQSLNYLSNTILETYLVNWHSYIMPQELPQFKRRVKQFSSP
jgi:hypothetical protein